MKVEYADALCHNMNGRMTSGLVRFSDCDREWKFYTTCWEFPCFVVHGPKGHRRTISPPKRIKALQDHLIAHGHGPKDCQC